MADVVGTLATSYDLPNYIGEVFFSKSMRPNAFLRLIGGLSAGVRTVGHWEFAMGVNYVVPVQTQPAILEGANPVNREHALTQAANLLQIFQEGVSMNYSAESSTDSIGGLAVIPGGSNGALIHPRSFEFQVGRAIERIQNQMNVSFLTGTYQKPVDNTTARKTRGVRTALATNVTDNAAAAMTKTNFEAALQAWLSNVMFLRGDELYVLGNAAAINSLIGIYESATRLPESRTVAGVQIWSIITKWCTLNVVYEPDVAAGELIVLQPSRIQPVAMPVVAGGMSKGILFREPLSHTGATTQEHVYGEWGVDYTDEIFHGVFKNFT